MTRTEITAVSLALLVAFVAAFGWSLSATRGPIAPTAAVDAASGPPRATLPDTDQPLDPLPAAVLGPVVTAAETPVLGTPVSELGDGKGEHDDPGVRP